MKRSVALGVDVGGTRIKSVVITQDGVVLDEEVRPTPQDRGRSLGDVVRDLQRGHDEALARRDGGVRWQAVGVVVPGVVDDSAGVGRYSANLRWKHLPVRDLVEQAVNLPTAVSHDVRAGLVAEHRLGAAVGSTNALFVPVGTGIAIAAMVSGRMIDDPYAGEIGHVVVDPDGDVCGCGSRGCLETVASARAIGRRFELATQTQWHGRGSAEVARLVAGDALAGNDTTVGMSAAHATRIWNGAVEALAGVMAPVILTLGSEKVVIGGGLVRSGETLLRPLREAVQARLGLRRTVKIEAAALGDRAGALGAGVLAWDASVR